uniref:Uncharacterized protein n=1 Tax=Rhizophagus irregularis (strain DAOM 181602 / DAOM 197198 / MUCL 43194) TaxID=747089 RepID=U9TF75_RHIID
MLKILKEDGNTSIAITQRGEFKNNTIKLKGLYIASLVYLIQQIHIRLEKKRQYAEFENQKT